MAKGPHTPRAALVLILLAAWPLATFPSTAGAPVGCGIAVASGCESWTAIHTGADDWSPDVVASPDGTRAFVIMQSRDTGEQAITVEAHDADSGALAWSSTYAPHNFPSFRMAAVSPDGSRLHIVGHGGAPSSTLWQGFVLTLDAHDGTILWATKWDVDSEGYAITVSPDSTRVYATGMSRGRDYVTLAFNAATGQKLWQTKYDNGGGHSGDSRGVASDIPYGISVAPDGAGVYVTGTSAAASGLLEAATVAYNAATGAQQWVGRAHATGALGAAVPTESYEVAAAPLGNALYVLGTHGLQAYDRHSGADLWMQPALACRPYHPMHSPGDCALEIHPGSERIFVGTQHAVAAFDALDGDEVWRLPLRAGVKGLPFNWGDNGLTGDMTMAPDGSRLYVATPGGRDHFVTDTASGINANFETMALDPSNGQPLWRTVYDRAYDRISSIDATAQRVFVTGESARFVDSDTATVAYDTNLGLQVLPTVPL